jgi:hypothetical protein
MQDEQSYDNFTLNFRIDENIPVNQYELDMYNAGVDGDYGVNNAHCAVDTIDGVKVLAYSIPATLPLAQFMRKKLYKGEFLEILSNILKKLIFFDEHNMPVKKVLLNTKYMYIELSTLDIQMVYMPVNKHFDDSNVCEFIQLLIEKLRFADIRSASCVEDILNYLDSRMMFSLYEFYNFVLKLEQDDMIRDDETGDEDTTVLSSMQYRNIIPHLVRERTKALITIEKSEFTIGKATDCDYSIDDNRKISRRHCTLIVKNGECYIRDENSTNHTYVNGRLIQPGFEVMLNDDDYIRMADEEFKYWVK